MRVGLVIVQKRIFDKKERLNLLPKILHNMKGCDICVLPGGFFRVPPAEFDEIKENLINISKGFKIPLVLGIDLIHEPSSKLPKHVQRESFPKILKFNSGKELMSLEPWALALINGDLKVEIFECWRPNGKHLFSSSNQKRTFVINGKRIAVLVCGDLLIPDIIEELPHADIYFDLAHWKLWPVQWINRALNLAKAKRSYVFITQHLSNLPGFNYAFSPTGNYITPSFEKKIIGMLSAVIRGYYLRE